MNLGNLNPQNVFSLFSASVLLATTFSLVILSSYSNLFISLGAFTFSNLGLGGGLFLFGVCNVFKDVFSNKMVRKCFEIFRRTKCFSAFWNACFHSFLVYRYFQRNHNSTCNVITTSRFTKLQMISVIHRSSLLLIFIKLFNFIKKRPQHRYFLVNIENFY